MSTELPKTPPSSRKPGEGQGESKRAIDEVIDTPEALRRVAKRVKGILDGMNRQSNAFDHPSTDNTSPNDNLEVPVDADDSLFDMSDFGCHEHVEQATFRDDGRGSHGSVSKGGPRPIHQLPSAGAPSDTPSHTEQARHGTSPTRNGGGAQEDISSTSPSPLPHT